MRTSKYSSYRGRSPWKSFFKALAVIVVILVVLAGAAALYVQQYLVVSSDGVRLDLPFFQQETPAPEGTPSAPVSDAPIVIVTPTPELTPEPDLQPGQDTETWAFVPVVFPAEGLYNGDEAKAQITAAGGDCALFNMKDDKGVLNHASSALARYTNQPLAGDGANASILTLNDTEDLYTVARVSCFRDDYLFYYDKSYPLYANSGDRWIDSDRIHWLAPTCFDVRAYLTEVCVELAELGFDEILLDHAGYPTRGNLHYIKKGDAYNSAQFSSVIDNFYAQVSSALSDYDIVLSVVTTQEALTGQDTLSGQTPENLARFDRIWLKDEAGNLSPAK